VHRPVGYRSPPKCRECCVDSLYSPWGLSEKENARRNKRAIVPRAVIEGTRTKRFGCPIRHAYGADDRCPSLRSVACKVAKLTGESRRRGQFIHARKNGARRGDAAPASARLVGRNTVFSNRSHRTSNRVSGAATRIWKTSDQRLASDFGAAARKVPAKDPFRRYRYLQRSDLPPHGGKLAFDWTLMRVSYKQMRPNQVPSPTLQIFVCISIIAAIGLVGLVLLM